MAAGLRTFAVGVVAWFSGGRTERDRRMRQRAVPLALIAFVSGLTGLIVGGTAGGGTSGADQASGARIMAESINRRPRVIGCEPGTETVVTNGSRTAGKVALREGTGEPGHHAARDLHQQHRKLFSAFYGLN